MRSCGKHADIQIILMLNGLYLYIAKYLPCCLKITGEMTYVNESYLKKGF